MDFSRADRAQLELIDEIVGEICDEGVVQPESILLLGAECRDILHAAQGHDFGLRGTTDLDLGLAIASWDEHDAAMQNFAPSGHTGIRYRIAGTAVDVMPFGSIEDPRGEVAPQSRVNEPFSVFAFQEVFDGAAELALPSGRAIKIPVPPGYAALKMRAWRDRWTSSYETKDAPDLATAAFWYKESTEVAERLWETEMGNAILQMVDYDVPVAAAQILGRDVAAQIGAQRSTELNALWGLLDDDDLARVFGDSALPHWPTDKASRRVVVGGLSAGLNAAVTESD